MTLQTCASLTLLAQVKEHLKQILWEREVTTAIVRVAFLVARESWRAAVTRHRFWLLQCVLQWQMTWQLVMQLAGLWKQRIGHGGATTLQIHKSSWPVASSKPESACEECSHLQTVWLQRRRMPSVGPCP
eukprot:401550-Rhodomonas_salina.2